MWLVFIESRPLPGEENAVDCYPDYRDVVSKTLMTEFGEQQIVAVVEFGEGDLGITEISAKGKSLARGSVPFGEIERCILKVQVASRLKKIGKRIKVESP